MTTVPDLSHHFVTGERANGDLYLYLTDDCPGWLREAVLDAHDDEVPNDWRHDVAHQIVRGLTGEHAPEVDWVDDYIEVYNLADTITHRETTWTSDVLRWAGENITRVGYYDVWLENGNADPATNPVDGLKCAMFQAIHEMTQTLAEAIRQAHAGDGSEV